MLHRRHFTSDQANALLPAVRAVLLRMQTARRSTTGTGSHNELAMRAESTGGEWPGRQRAEAAVTVALCSEWMEALGVLVRDVERGLVDFPALVDGREIYLCWEVGEPVVGHWHEIDSGFAGRRRIGSEAPRR